MANRDIAGLLTGIPSGGIDPRVGMTGRQMLVHLVVSQRYNNSWYRRQVRSR
jgi:hypothetical protein